MNKAAVRELQNNLLSKISELEGADIRDEEMISKLKAKIIDLEFDLFMGKNTDK